MSIFQLDTAFILEVASVAAGLITLHKAAKEPPAGLLRAAGFLLIVAGILSAACTVYFGIKYRGQGDFDRGTMMRQGMIQNDPMPGKIMMDSLAHRCGGNPPMGVPPASVPPSPLAQRSGGDPITLAI